MSFETNAGVDNESYGIYKYNVKAHAYVFHPLGRRIDLSAISENLETGAVRMTLRFKFADRDKTVDLSREAFADHKLLIGELAKAGADVTVTHAPVIIDTLRQQQDEIEQNGDVCKVFSGLGWFNAPIYSSGKTARSQLCYRLKKLIGGPYPATYEGNFAVSSSGDITDYLQMLRHDVVGHTALEVVFLTAISAVPNYFVARYRGGLNPILHLCAPSSSGKSTAAALAVSAFGAPFAGSQRGATTQGGTYEQQSLHRQWGATANAVVNRCKGTQGVPIILDELGKFAGGDLTATIYHLSEGTDKERLNGDLRSNLPEAFRASILSMGEMPLLSRCKSKLEGLRVRVLEMDEALTCDSAHSDRIKKVCAENYGHVAPRIADKIISVGGCDYVLGLFDGFYAQLRGQFPDTPMRDRFIATFPALILTASAIVRDALGIDFDDDALVDFFLRHEEKHGGERNTARDAYDCVIQEARVHEKSFRIDGGKELLNEPRGEVFGKIDYRRRTLRDGRIVAETYLIRKPFLLNVLERKGFQNTHGIFKSWRDDGLLDCDADRFTRSRKITSQGKPEDLYVLRVFADENDIGRSLNLLPKGQSQLPLLLAPDDVQEVSVDGSSA